MLSTKSIGLFKENARKELDVMGIDFVAIERYTFVVEKALIIKKPMDPDDIFDFGGYGRKDLEYSVGSYNETIKFAIIPELFVHYTMKKEDISYKSASIKLYAGNGLPTTHHVNRLFNVSLLITLYFLIFAAVTYFQFKASFFFRRHKKQLKIFKFD